jgi:sugar phosphate isomerase/epimerase
MEIGYRIIRPEDVGAQPLRFAQISLWRTAAWGVTDGERAVSEAIGVAAECGRRGIRTVFHPLEYSLTGGFAAETMDVMRRLASAADLGIIIHDEGGAGGQRFSAAEETVFEKNLCEISALTPVSIENAFNSGDITRFWERFVAPAPKTVSITLDIGHLESADIDSIAFVRDLPGRLLERVRFVHMHHRAEERYGVRDHWPLVPGCREIEALKSLLARKRDLWVVLELEAKEAGVRESAELLQGL